MCLGTSVPKGDPQMAGGDQKGMDPGDIPERHRLGMVAAGGHHHPVDSLVDVVGACCPQPGGDKSVAW